MPVKPISVANPSFTLETQARDCPPLQFVREFTLNAIEAIEARRETADAKRRPERDQIVWREFTELGDRAPASKLACIDTGIGMDPDEMEKFINALASTSKDQGLLEHYGMGAKIAGAAISPAGVTYLSWRGTPESGKTCTLVREPATGVWGLDESPLTGEIIKDADPGLCPIEIQRAGWRGTAVVFVGKSDEDDTTSTPVADFGVDWLEKTINIRFYELPEDIPVRCQRTGGGDLRQARGQRVLLEKEMVAGDIERLSDAWAYWWILDEAGGERRRKQNSRWAATGHRAALYRGELYELRQHSAGGWRKLQEFGILFGHQRVVIYVEPDEAVPNTARSRILPVEAEDESRELPWERWGDEFIAKMPQPLRELVEQSAGEQADADRRDIMRQIEKIAEDMPIPQYRQIPESAIGGGVPTHGSQPEKETETGRGTGKKPGTVAGRTHGGAVVSLFERQGGPPVVEEPHRSLPEIKTQWISRELGTRPPDVLEDLGATFIMRQGIVQLNLDFRGVQALLRYFRKRYRRASGSEPIVLAEVKAACADQVVDFIIGILRLRSQPHWTGPSVEHALDDYALTGCLMQHATLFERIDERLARRLRKAA